MTNSKTPKMPERPADAWWSEEDNEWVRGDKDEEGCLTGLVRYWNKAGVFISDCEHRDGKPHGRARRFYSDGSIEQDCRYIDGVITGTRRICRPESEDVEALAAFKGVHPAVVFYECYYEEGDIIGMSSFNDKGKKIQSDGQPMPERPPGVPPTASPLQGGWLFMRRKGEDGTEVLEMRTYYGDGTLKTERLLDGTSRSFHPSGAIESEGQRVQQEKRRPEHGWWHYGDADGVIRRKSNFEFGVELERRYQRLAADTVGDGESTKAQGPISEVDGDFLESGEWQFINESGSQAGSQEVSQNVSQTVDFGKPQDTKTLLDSPLLQDDVSDETLEMTLDKVGPAARIARIRLAGRRRDEAFLEGAVHSGTPWIRLSYAGEPLTKGGLPNLVNALLFNDPFETLRRLGSCFFAEDRARVALDIADAALCIAPDDAGLKELQVERVSYLRALGEEELVTIAMTQIHNGRDFNAEEALLLRIRDEPKNTTLRLEFADLVADTEPDHAALIRIDCGGGNVDERAAILQRLQSTLPEELASETKHIKGGFFDVNRFFDLEGEVFLEHHEMLFRWTPFVTCLDLVFASDEIARIAVLPSLGRYTELNFQDTLLFQGRAAQLASSPHLSQLEVLGLYDSSLYNEDLEAILRSTAYPRLRELDISNQRSGQDYDFEGFKVLTESVFAPTLEVLSMNRRYFSDDITPVIAALPCLHHLEIEFLDLGDEGLKGLVGLENKWTTLNLDRCDISAEGMKAFCGSDGIKTLTRLDIGHNNLGEEGVKLLLAAPLSNLESLSLDWEPSGIGEAFGNAMIESPMASSLVNLSLSYAKPGLGPRGSVALSKAPLTVLQRLDLHNNAIGDVGIKAIASSPNFRELRFLNVSQCGITDEGGRALANSPYLEHLKWIEFGGTELSEEVQKALESRFGAGVKFEYPWNR